MTQGVGSMTWLRLRGPPEASSTRPSLRQGAGILGGPASVTAPAVEHLAEGRLDPAREAGVVTDGAAVEPRPDAGAQSVEARGVGGQVAGAGDEILRAGGDQFGQA